MDIQATLERVESLAAPVLKGLGYDLIERELVMEAGRWVLRLYIDREGGITISDCERASRGVEDLIEVEGVIGAPHSLEVSSPGIDRPLRRREDFERYRGRQIRLKALRQIAGRANFKGRLEGLEGDFILMDVDGARLCIPFDALAKARVEPEKAVGRRT